ncbi:type II toxin-antitoxin system HicB family antitoxin [Lacticaseibacillus sharpeae]|uniref:HicB-like antitoxin of toxin-antitoxin system domain-containing protein n=1 Tax=Lacticaseibacillus sharpeae JCM 1186 = DSM 20505 TaxID=1291052 RepID=A0A0R1ZM99_9LACO|nr:type II toxin-antitoxin system HicB family antitoxin [Lacticaseibacillus sharpeae]KRM55474.1 hypothetical protein FC18_GL001370 [Lacticaseibacillus sharpeae JCM 1186 = DSM 20505]
MKKNILMYPTIFEEITDESGHYYVVSSPNIPGMHTDGATMQEAVEYAVDAIATMLDGEQYPQPDDPTAWTLQANQQVVYVSVDMDAWQAEKMRMRKLQTVRRTITIPEYLNDQAKALKINVSRVATEALERVLNTAK